LHLKSDWKTRQLLAEGKVAPNKPDKLRKKQLGVMDMYYDLLAWKESDSSTVKSGAGKKLREQGKLGPIDQAKIDWLQTRPPDDTRALLRGKL
ncbi:MAG: hypothetical protein ACREHG_01500, partial [Candidatus Saccharimonadales bacterium]